MSNEHTISDLIKKLEEIKKVHGDKYVITQSYRGGDYEFFYAEVIVNSEGNVEIVPRGQF